MNHGLKKMLCVVLLLAAVGISAFFAYRKATEPKQARRPEGYEGLYAVSYTLSGGEFGGYYVLELEKNAGGDLLTERQADSFRAKEQLRQRKLPENTINELEALLAGYHPEEWSSYPNEYEILDASTAAIYLDYTGARHYSMRSEQAAPAEEADAMRLVRSFLTGCLDR